MHAFSLAFPGALVTYICVAAFWLAPLLAKRPKEDALAMLCVFHGLRAPFGMALLAPGVGDPAVTTSFRQAVAYGDFASAVLGITAAFLLHRRHPLGISAAWVFSVVGVLDLGHAVYQGNVQGVFDHPLGIAFTAVTVYVPALWVTHTMVILRLLRKEP